MNENEDSAPTASDKERWKMYRDRHKQHIRELVEKREEIRASIHGINYIIVVPSNINMKFFNGTEGELTYAVENLYANDGRDFDPSLDYPPTLLINFGKDYALHAQGIYYRQDYSEDFVTGNRKIWIPSFSEDERESPDTQFRKSRAEIFANHSRNNETWCKSEYAWEADAWSDVFRPMRDDPCLAIDKHSYMTLVPDTDPILCKLTGKSSFVKRTPDATFGLATFTEGDTGLPPWTSDLLWDRLERLTLHPKYGLIVDPSRTETHLIFPFMVYEAKGWGGDCRSARRQACSAAAFYLDMLDDLVRQPGPVGSPRPYQTSTSHNYQVFALTSFGAYWHLLVGYKRPRLATEYADETGMSETVYIFQRLWSGHVTNKKAAYELLDLVDKIHLWAMTEYRTFILEHLRPWNKLCEENYLLDWDSMYDLGEDKKRKRTYSETEDLKVPSWVNDMSVPSRRKFQELAKVSLDQAIEEHQLAKGKSLSDSTVTLAQISHSLPERVVAGLRWSWRREDVREYIQNRLRRGIMASGYLWPGFLKRRRIDNDDDDDDIVGDIEVLPEEVVSYDRVRIRHTKVTEPISED